MFEQLGFETLNPVQASLILALILGALFGAIAQHLKFCFRSAVMGMGNQAQSARGLWLVALGTAVLVTQLLTVTGYISFDGHRLLDNDLPIAAILVGGVMFGIGMVLTRGCISRLTVLTGSGNLRALTVLIVFAVLAHATLKGVLAPLRVWLGSVTLPMGEVSSLADVPGGAAVWAVVLALTCLPSPPALVSLGAKRSGPVFWGSWSPPDGLARALSCRMNLTLSSCNLCHLPRQRQIYSFGLSLPLPFPPDSVSD